MVALWVEFGIHPNDVVAAHPDLQDDLERYLVEKAERRGTGGLPGPANRRLTDAEMMALVLESERAMS